MARGRGELAAEFPDVWIEIFVVDAVLEAYVKAALTFAHSMQGRHDIIVSAVGAAIFKPLLMRELEDVRAEMDVNFSTAFLALRHGVPLMKSGGTTTCISTAAVTQANWELSIYTAAKQRSSVRACRRLRTRWCRYPG